MKLKEFTKLPFEYIYGFTTDEQAQRLHRNDEHGLQIETFTRRKQPGNPYGGWCHGKRYFYLDRDPAQYRSMTALWRAWKRREGVK